MIIQEEIQHMLSFQIAGPTCQPDYFLCGDGECITKAWVCDSYSDCSDDTDEDKATCATCPFRFLCTNGRCIDFENICDGANDCRDNSDEENICVGELIKRTKEQLNYILLKYCV